MQLIAGAGPFKLGVLKNKQVPYWMPSQWFNALMVFEVILNLTIQDSTTPDSEKEFHCADVPRSTTDPLPVEW